MSRKGENIYKRKDGRWEGRYLKRSPDGPRYGYVYARTYREAKQRLHEASTQWAEQPVPDPQSPTLEDLAVRWGQSIAPRVKESTLVKYHSIVCNHLLPAMGDVPVSSMTHGRIDAFATELLERGGEGGKPLSPRTVSDVLSVLRGILRYGIQNDIPIPCDGSTVHVSTGRAEIQVLTLNEQKMLSAYLYKYISLPNLGILLSLYTGLRVGEVCALRWEDIDTAEGVVYIRRTAQRLRNLQPGGPRTRVMVTAPKSPSSKRVIPLPEELTAILTAMPCERTGWFLTGQEDRLMEPRAMQHHFRRVLEEVGLPPTNYHTLRHTFATRCVELGFDPKLLSELLGHSTVSMTMDRYVHPTMAHKRQYMERLTELLPQNRDNEKRHPHRDTANNRNTTLNL